MENKEDILDQEATSSEGTAEEIANNNDEPSGVEKIEPEFSLEDQVKDLEDRNLRLLAEMQNLRARQQKDLKDTREYAVTGFAQDMISVMENVHRARDAIPNAEDELYKKILTGIDLTVDELKRVFAKHGIERVAPEPGAKFDYNVHQAIVQVPTNEFNEGEVVSLIHAGYTLKDRVLKPAMVAVAKKAPEATDNKTE